MSGLLSFAQGGASQSITNAESALNPLGTATQQMYGGAIGQLMGSPTGYQQTALAGAQGAFSNATLGAGGYGPTLSALMKPYQNMQQGLSFNSYLGSLAQLSGATSAGQQATSMQQMNLANQQASTISGLGSLAGLGLSQLGQSYAPTSYMDANAGATPLFSYASGGATSGGATSGWNPLTPSTNSYMDVTP